MEEVIGSIPIIAMQIFIYINKSLPATGYTGCIARLTGSGGAGKTALTQSRTFPPRFSPAFASNAPKQGARLQCLYRSHAQS
jgi:hypothetical protein